MPIIACLVALVALPDNPGGTLGFGGTDFVQYYVAWELIREGKDPYDSQLNGPRQIQLGATEPIPIYAPPWSFLPALPISGLSFHNAANGFIAINLCLLALITLGWNSLLGSLQWRFLPFIVFGVCCWLGTLLVLGHGQISLWPLAGFTGWLWCIKRQRYLAAGLFLVLTIIKPHTGLLPGLFAGVYSLRQRHWSTIGAFALGVLVTAGVMIWFRPSIFADYWRGMQTGTIATEYYTATLDGWLRFNFSKSLGVVSWTLWGAALLGAALVAWIGFKPGISEKTEPDSLLFWSIVACMATVVFVPYAHQHDFVFMLPGFFLASESWLRGRQNGRAAIFIWLVLYMLFIYTFFAWIKNPQVFFVSWVGLGITIWLLRDRLWVARFSPAA